VKKIYKEVEFEVDVKFHLVSSIMSFIPVSKLILSIPHICRGHHGRCPCKKILSGVKFSRLNAKNCMFYTFWGYLL